jgi:hypothetical protein
MNAGRAGTGSAASSASVLTLASGAAANAVFAVRDSEEKDESVLRFSAAIAGVSETVFCVSPFCGKEHSTSSAAKTMNHLSSRELGEFLLPAVRPVVPNAALATEASMLVAGSGVTGPSVTFEVVLALILPFFPLGPAY